jgi:hypothetical protein
MIDIALKIWAATILVIVFGGMTALVTYTLAASIHWLVGLFALTIFAGSFCTYTN